jgi:hypothetical protein
MEILRIERLSKIYGQGETAILDKKLGRYLDFYLNQRQSRLYTLRVILSAVQRCRKC